MFPAIDEHAYEVLNNNIPRSSYDVPQLNSSIQSNNFIVFHHNIRSFNCNSDQLLLLLTQLKYKVHVILQSETWFSECLMDSIVGYTGFHSCRPGGGGGGVSVFVASELQASASPHLHLRHSRVMYGRGVH